ncbi:phosphotransferase family protein [Thalassiella azotivora]
MTTPPEVDGPGSRQLPGLDLDRLTDHLTRQGIAPAGPLTASIVPGGRSNLTYRVTDGSHRWVLRRPPLGHVLATAHDMAREHRVISALAGTPVPVPATVLLCQDDAVLGAPFYVMEQVDGTPYRHRDELTSLGPQRTREIAHRLVDTLVDLHDVDYEAVGLGDFGRPEGYLERQVRRWGTQLDASRSRDVEGVDALRDRLAASVPASAAPTVVHGDYRLDNVLVDDDGRLTAVLDWEMATLGDPLTDVGLLVMYSGRTLSQVPGAPVSDAATAPGYPAASELAQRYAERSGRDLGRLEWYVAMSYFKLAVILEGIHLRYTQGKTVGAGFDRIGDLVLPLVQAGLSTLDDGTEH